MFFITLFFGGAKMYYYEVAVVGAGQASLAMGYYLKQASISYILLEANLRIGDSWRNRYESLVLFTPRCYSFLPGLKMNGFLQKMKWLIIWNHTKRHLICQLNLIHL